MGETMSCCNPSTTMPQLQKIFHNQNQQLFPLNKTVDALNYFREPNDNIVQLLQKGQRYLQQRGKPINIVDEQIYYKEIKNLDNQIKYIFSRGANFDQVINGDAIIYFLNGQIFKGHIDNSKPIYGVFIYNSNCFYAGQISNLNAEGQGIFQNHNSGYTYEGNWSKSMPHGMGKQTYSNGDHYEGQLMYGAKFGRGIYRFADGKVYNGEFYNNKSDGKGVLVYKNGNQYSGDWKLGYFHGHGKFVWVNGQFYEGQYKQSTRHGIGTYNFHDGRIYQGEWMNGFQQGRGKLQSKYDEIKGIWKEGQFVDSHQ